MIRAVQFIREWRGKLGRDDVRDIELTYGQRELLVQRGFARWDEAEENPAPNTIAASQPNAGYIPLTQKFLKKVPRETTVR